MTPRDRAVMLCPDNRLGQDRLTAEFSGAENDTLDRVAAELDRLFGIRTSAGDPFDRGYADAIRDANRVIRALKHKAVSS